LKVVAGPANGVGWQTIPASESSMYYIKYKLLTQSGDDWCLDVHFGMMAAYFRFAVKDHL
jgi:hypothetical protein